MQKIAPVAAVVLLIWAGVLPFTPLGVWSVVPMVAAIAGAVVLLLNGWRSQEGSGPPAGEAGAAAMGEEPRQLRIG
jgi:hypothetical protein